MQKKILPSLFFSLALSATFLGIFSISLPHAEAAGFVIFDAFIQKDGTEPDFASYGLQKIRIVYAQSLFDKIPGCEKGNKCGELDVNEAKAREFLSRKYGESSTGHIAMDIEHLCLGVFSWCTAAERDRNIRTFLKVIAIAKQEVPNGGIGFYGVPPSPFGSGAVNDFLKPIADRVDMLMPGIYRNHVDREEWLNVAERKIKESKRIAPGKPVYLFVKTIWNIHAPEPYKNSCISYSDSLYFLREIKKRGADGVIIWDKWDPKCAGGMWAAVKDFIAQDLGGKPGVPPGGTPVPGGSIPPSGGSKNFKSLFLQERRYGARRGCD